MPIHFRRTTRTPMGSFLKHSLEYFFHLPKSKEFAYDLSTAKQEIAETAVEEGSSHGGTSIGNWRNRWGWATDGG